MDLKRIVIGAITGSLFMAIALAASEPFVSKISRVESGPIGNSHSFLIVGMIVVGVYGLVTGALEGIIISNFEWSFFTNILVGLLIHLFFGFVLVILTGGGWGDSMTKTYYASLIIGTINGAVISTVNLWYQALK